MGEQTTAAVSSESPDDLLTTDDLAAIKQTTVAAVHTAYGRGQLPVARRVGRRLMWRRGEIQSWLDEQLGAPRSRRDG